MDCMQAHSSASMPRDFHLHGLHFAKEHPALLIGITCMCAEDA